MVQGGAGGMLRNFLSNRILSKPDVKEESKLPD